MSLRLLKSICTCFLLLVVGTGCVVHRQDLAHLFWSPSLESELTYVAPADVAVRVSDLVGPVFTSADGMTLYTNSLDAPGGTSFGCSDKRFKQVGTIEDGGYPLPRADARRTCVERWIPFQPSDSAVVEGEWTVVQRPGGGRQWAYREQPVYLSARDVESGDTYGTMGLAKYGAWQILAADVLDFPPGVGFDRRLEGLFLSDKERGFVLVTSQGGGRLGNEVAAETPWVPLLAPYVARVADGQFGITDLADGTRQWSFGGAPLYRARPGTASVQVQRSVSDGPWRPVLLVPARPRPEFVGLEMTVPELGWVYTDSGGLTLYAFYCLERTPDRLHCDEVGDPAAYWTAVCGIAENCAKEWKPVLASTTDKSIGHWRVADVPYPQFSDPLGGYGEDVPTVKAWTFHGRPVYTFAGDSKPGDVHGHGIEARESGFGALAVLGKEFPLMP